MMECRQHKVVRGGMHTDHIHRVDLYQSGSWQTRYCTYFDSGFQHNIFISTFKNSKMIILYRAGGVMMINNLACVKISIIGQLLFDILRYRVATPVGPVGAQKYHHLEVDGMHVLAAVGEYIHTLLH